MSPETAALEPTEPSALEALIARLRSERDALERAEQAAEGIGGLLSRAEGAAEDPDSEKACEALEREAQGIRDRLRDARLDLNETIRRLSGAVARQAIRSEVGRAVLESINRLSPYPSVRTADEALGLLEALSEEQLAGEPPTADPAAEPSDPAEKASPAVSTLASLPRDGPSSEDRERMVALLEDAIYRVGDNYKSAAGRIGITENTLRSFRRGQEPSAETWRKIRRYVKKNLSGPAD